MSQVKELFKSKSFCILPFMHAATLTDGSMPLCCVAENASNKNLNYDSLEASWNSEYIKDVRSKMLGGEAVPACKRCHEEECSGYRSHRVVENKVWLEKLGEEQMGKIINRVDGEGHTSEGIIAIDLRLGNTCNLQCVMCQPQESSKWRSATDELIEEIKDEDLKNEWKYKANINKDLFEWYKREEFWADLKNHLPYLREIIVGGGEPMLSKEHLAFIKECADSGEASHIHLRYHTNLTIFPEEMIPYWEKFQKVEFFTSIDGYGKVGDYVRYPAQWKVVECNIRKIDSLKDNIWLRMLYSVHALNVHHLPEFLLWVKKQNFKKAKLFYEENRNPGIQSLVHPGIVHWPKYLCIKTLPQNYKDKITRSWAQVRKIFPDENFDKFEGIISFMNSEDGTDKLSQLKDYIRVLDKTRGTEISQVAPELCQALESLTKVTPTTPLDATL